MFLETGWKKVVLAPILYFLRRGEKGGTVLNSFDYNRNYLTKVSI
jgi:hypothetical protein